MAHPSTPNPDIEIAQPRDAESLGSRFRALRTSLNLSQSAMAAFISKAEQEFPEQLVSSSSGEKSSSAKSRYQHWEKGTRRPKNRLYVVYMAAECRKLNPNTVTMDKVEDLIRAYEPARPLTEAEREEFFQGAMSSTAQVAPHVPAELTGVANDSNGNDAAIEGAVSASSDMQLAPTMLTPVNGNASNTAAYDRTRAHPNRLTRSWRPVIALGLLILAVSLLAVFLPSFVFVPSTSPDTTPRPTRDASATLVASVPPQATSTELGQRVPPTATISITPTQLAVVSSCGEAGRVTAPQANRLLRDQGVSSFTRNNTDGAVHSNKVRYLAIDPRGLWIAYFSSEDTPFNGIGQYDKQSWANCPIPTEDAGNNINALAIDGRGRVWAAAEKNGVLMFDGLQWRNYTITHGLPTIETFGVTVDQKDNIWVSTWEGVAKYDETTDRWTVPYKVGDRTIFNNHIHRLAFDGKGNIWVGHMGRGVSQYNSANGKWVHHTADKGGIASDEIFGIAVRKADAASPESVWFATSNGVSKYEEGVWTIYRSSQGLPHDSAQAVAVDHYNRVWVATSGGVAYLDEQTWIVYNTIPTLSIAFGPPCSACPFDVDHVWTGTVNHGLTHSRLPIPRNIQVVDVISVKYRKEDASEEPFRDEITVAPGDKILVEIVVSPRAPYTLTQARGDFLSSLEEDESKRYGAFEQMAVKGTVESGQRFTFTDHDKPFIAPELPEGVQEQKFTSRWRLWMYTRYVGPIIEVTFTVRRPVVTSLP
jgi:transcriptional regulator with XRE-family HTH domain